MRARILTQGGKFVAMDPRTIETPAKKQGDAHTYSDWRTLRAPLPAIHVGAIIESLVVVHERKPLSSAGDLYSYTLGDYVPVTLSRVVVDYPSKTRIKFRTSQMGKTWPVVSKSKGRTRRIYSMGLTKAYDIEGGQPFGRARALCLF